MDGPLVLPSDLQFIIIIIFVCPPFWPDSRFELPSSAAVYPLSSLALTRTTLYGSAHGQVRQALQ